MDKYERNIYINSNKHLREDKWAVCTPRWRLGSRLRLGATSLLLQFGLSHPSHFNQPWYQLHSAALPSCLNWSRMTQQLVYNKNSRLNVMPGANCIHICMFRVQGIAVTDTYVISNLKLIKVNPITGGFLGDVNWWGGGGDSPRPRHISRTKRPILIEQRPFDCSQLELSKKVFKSSKIGSQRTKMFKKIRVFA